MREFNIDDPNAFDGMTESQKRLAKQRAELLREAMPIFEGIVSAMKGRRASPEAFIVGLSQAASRTIIKVAEGTESAEEYDEKVSRYTGLLISTMIASMHQNTCGATAVTYTRDPLA